MFVSENRFKKYINVLQILQGVYFTKFTKNMCKGCKRINFKKYVNYA